MIKWIIIIIFIIMAWYVIGELWEEEKKKYRDKERWNLLNEEEQKKRWEGRRRY